MIAPITINPKPENNKAKIFVAVFGALGGLIFIFGTFAELYGGVISLVGMMLIIAAITISVKYIMSSFVYEITEVEGEWLFVVGQYSGKRYTTLCRVGLASVRSIEKKQRNEKADSPDVIARFTNPAFLSREYARYSYIPTMMPDSYYVMTVENRYEKAKISLQLTDGMAEQLRLFAKEARELYIDEE